VRKLRGGQIPPEILAVAEALRIDDAARLFGISRSTIYNLLNAGLLPSARLGGRRVIARADLLALLHPELTALAKK
jgi:excisionase family DNA binding protein